MTLYGVNNGISLQESQLIYMLQQQAPHARGHGTQAHGQTWATATGQNMPGGESAQSQASDAQSPTQVAQWQPTDPALSPENISALLIQLQTQQSSLDTTLLLSNSDAGPGGKTLLDYLTDGDNISNDAATEDSENAVSVDAAS